MPPTWSSVAPAWSPRHAVRPEPRRAREGDHADGVLRLQLRGQHAQRLADDRHAVGALHRAGIVEQQHQVQRPARLPARRRRLDGEPQQLAVVRERITRPLGRERHRLALRPPPGRDNRRH